MHSLTLCASVQHIYYALAVCQTVYFKAQSIYWKTKGKSFSSVDLTSLKKFFKKDGKLENKVLCYKSSEKQVWKWRDQ